MKLTWFGHSAFSLEFADKKIMIDPFLSGNGSFTGDWQEVSEGATHVLLTHGHADHLGDSLEICKNNNSQLVANFEIAMYLVGKGLPQEQINPANPGGTVNCGGFTTTLVKAEHSSSVQQENGESIYLGAACGLVMHIDNEKTVYHMGDTDIFGDMALIQELHHPHVGIVPVGDRFTMGGAVAALACQRYFSFERVIPCHYGTFPIIDQDPSLFVKAMEDSETAVEVLQSGSSIEI